MKITSFEYQTSASKSAHYKALDALRVSMSSESYQEIQTDRLTDRPFLAWLPVDFCNGTIEVDVASDLADDAPE